MSTSERTTPTTPRDAARGDQRFDRRVALAVVLAANLLLTLALPGLARRRFGADSSEPAVEVMSGGRPSFDVRNLLRNETTTAQLFDAVRDRHAILYFGTSESGIPANLGAQLNAVVTDGP
ncbi:MAG TPA: hypothetical protein VJV75_05355, partial [Candidatus Polarisedimenticolia bacterium]|nr:hypothetical protein [Candidatus Polarisedimenticolia bacterium]